MVSIDDDDPLADEILDVNGVVRADPPRRATRDSTLGAFESEIEQTSDTLEILERREPSVPAAGLR